MRIHYLQHVPFEDPANILVWAGKRGHALSKTLLFKDEPLPDTDSFDMLVVMGGPMGVYDEDSCPWLAQEKRFIEGAIGEGKTVLGVCLGAQLIADVLGARVYRNAHKEIGWFPVTLTGEAKESSIFGTLPEDFTAFHWHGDTFDIPSGCTRTAGSEGCKNQAFEYEGRVVGLQFHLESTVESIGRLIENCGDELVEGRYIQSAGEMLSRGEEIKIIGNTMGLLLDRLEEAAGAGHEEMGN